MKRSLIHSMMLTPLLAGLTMCPSRSVAQHGSQPVPPKERLLIQLWKAGQAVSPQTVAWFGEERCFAIDTLSDEIFQRMWLKSYRRDCPVPRRQLRYLRLLHRDADGNILLGELVCHVQIAGDLLEIFRELYRQSYPIGRMVLVDIYDADDEQSMAANNTTCFNFRQVAGSKQLSKHARGLAVDVNPLYNPCVRRLRNGQRVVQPAAGAAYVDRTQYSPYRLTRGDLCYRLFVRHGFRWGGDWTRTRDYQHFEK